MKKTQGLLLDTDRYLFDEKLCKPGKGWAQVDTTQDAPHFGAWVNPSKRCIITFSEGDYLSRECESDEEFVKELTEFVEWNRESGYWLGIDDGGYKNIRARFHELGMEGFLYPLPASASAEGQAAQSPSPD